MELIEQIENILWNKTEISKYKYVYQYIKEWQECYEYDGNGNEILMNFQIATNVEGNIDLSTTLHSMPEDTLLKVALDLGIKIPILIPSIPQIQIKLEKDYKYAYKIFEKACRKVLEDPSDAILLANSMLETIIKHILETEVLNIKYDQKDTTYDLAKKILKGFTIFPNKGLEQNIKNISSSLLTISQSIEILRSNITVAHGKGTKDYIIDESLYANFVVNTVSAIGLFLIDYFDKYQQELDDQRMIEECFGEK